MGFKSGFPSPLFNPLGFRGEPLWKTLSKKCGLLSYSDKVDSGIMYDKLGQTRDAVLAKSLDGDGSMYYDTGIVPNQNTVLRVWGNFNSLVSSLHGERSNDSNSDFDFGLLGNQWRADWGNNVILVSGVADINKHKFEISNGEFFIDDVKVGGTFGADIGNPTDSIFLQALNNNGLSDLECNFTLDRCEIDHNGKTYTLDIPGLSSDIIQLVNLDDSSDFIQGTLMLPSATPTSFTDKVVSIEDMYGYTIADGSQYRDSALTQQYLVGAIIPCDKRGISFSFVSDGAGGSLQPRADYVGRVGIDYRIVDGIVDNGVENSKWLTSDPDVTIESTGLTWNPSGGADIATLPCKLKAGTVYTGVVDILQNDQLAQNFRIMAATFGISAVTVTLPISVIGEYRFTFTTDAVISDEVIKVETTTSMIASEIIKLNNYRIYEGDFVTGNPPLPTSQELVVGNSVILNDTYCNVTTTDNNEVLWDKTNLVNKVVPVENINYYDQFFINADETRISYYDSELTEPCLTKALKLEKLVEPLEDINGEPLYDIDGNRLYAYKDGVEEVR